MFSFQPIRPPSTLARIQNKTAALGFDMCSDDRTGQVLQCLAASKSGGRVLELGTGTGLATAWVLSGMTGDAQLDSVDTDETIQSVAIECLDQDPRVRFHCIDGGAFLQAAQPERYDLIFADAWPGKFSGLDHTLSLLRPGGFYVIDDLLPQPNWPDGHQANVDALLDTLEARDSLTTLRLDWSTGLMIAVRV